MPLRYPDFFCANVNRFTLVGRTGSDDSNREATQGVARSGAVPKVIRSSRGLESDAMETHEIRKSLTNGLLVTSGRGLSRRSVLGFAGVLGAAAPFGVLRSGPRA